MLKEHGLDVPDVLSEFSLQNAFSDYNYDEQEEIDVGIRSKVIQEVIDTERDYVNDLDIIINVFFSFLLFIFDFLSTSESIGFDFWSRAAYFICKCWRVVPDK